MVSLLIFYVSIEIFQQLMSYLVERNPTHYTRRILWMDRYIKCLMVGTYIMLLPVAAFAGNAII